MILLNSTIYCIDSTDISITQTTINTPGSGAEAYKFIDSNNIYLANNKATNCGCGIVLARVKYATIKNTVLKGTEYYYGLYIQESRFLFIDHNHVAKFLYPLVIHETILCFFTHNNIFGSGHGIGGALQSYLIFFYNNYWNRPRILPRIILRTIVITNPNLPHYYIIPTPLFDLRPAKLPYNIEGIL
jgi:parallel beta-helix repeat protein